MKVYIINSITKSYILNIKIRSLVTEYALMINPNAYFGHSWSYFDIQNLRLLILYLVNVKRLESQTLLGAKTNPKKKKKNKK